MFAKTYFPGRYFAAAYFPQGTAANLGTPGPHPLTVDFDSERKRVDFSMTSAEEE